jgi:hypothetical protein
MIDGPRVRKTNGRRASPNPTEDSRLGRDHLDCACRKADTDLTLSGTVADRHDSDIRRRRGRVGDFGERYGGRPDPAAEPGGSPKRSSWRLEFQRAGLEFVSANIRSTSVIRACRFRSVIYYARRTVLRTIWASQEESIACDLVSTAAHWSGSEAHHTPNGTERPKRRVTFHVDDQLIADCSPVTAAPVDLLSVLIAPYLITPVRGESKKHVRLAGPIGIVPPCPDESLRTRRQAVGLKPTCHYASDEGDKSQ